MLKLPFYNKKKLLLAFEYAVVMADVAKQHGVELTPELIERAERMIINEFSTKTPTRLSVEMTPNILSVFETSLVE